MPKTEKKDYIELNISTFLIPAAIVIAGVIIAAVIFVSARNGEKAEVENNDTNTQQGGTFSDPNIISSSVTIDFDGGAYIGDIDKAKYAIVEFSDYQCPYCERHSLETTPLIRSKYVDNGEVVYFYRELAMYPPNSTKLSLAGLCIFEEEGLEKYLDFRSLAYTLEFTEDAELISAVEGLNIDNAKFKSCYENDVYGDRVSINEELSRGAGVQGVPGFIVGKLSEDGKVEGFLIPGAYPIDTFDEVLEYLKK